MNFEELLEVAKKLVVSLGKDLIKNVGNTKLKEFEFDKNLPKEIKAKADKFLEEQFVDSLKPLGISILTEETGLIMTDEDSDLIFILDPLDGTFNYVKGYGPCAISLALWKADTPIFGVIYDLESAKLSWGGKEFGSFTEGEILSVSELKNTSEASLCSGFPVRFEPEGEDLVRFFKVLKQFAKVRMIGSAAISLNNVAQGLVDVYYEEDIMLWDVAAGLAILEGAGGTYSISLKETRYSVDILAANKELIENINI